MTDIDGLNKDLARARNEQQEHLRTLKSGAVYDTQLGQIVAKRPGPYDITPERSQELHLARNAYRRKRRGNTAQPVAAEPVSGTGTASTVLELRLGSG